MTDSDARLENEASQFAADCPGCGGEMYLHTRNHGVFWCDDCEREFWKDGGEWFSCDESGVYERV